MTKELPEAIVPALLKWYRASARDLPWRHTKDPYRIWISEIMLQQTRVDTVIPYYEHFLSVFPDVLSLASADDGVLLKCWEGLGYYTRARNLKKAAIRIAEAYQGRFPERFEEIRTLPGIGDYTAGAIASIAFQQPVPAVDGNVLRVLARVTADDADIMQPAVRKQAAERLKKLYPEGACGDFTQSLMELGAIVCLPNGKPCCDRCPLATLCLAHRNAAEQAYPVKKAAKTRDVIELTVFIAENSAGEMLLTPKKEQGVLENLWSLPYQNGVLPETEARVFWEQRGFTVRKIEKEPDQRHVFTHLEWRMTVYRVLLDPEPALPLTGRWVSAEELKKEIMLPTAFRKLLK